MPAVAGAGHTEARAWLGVHVGSHHCCLPGLYSQKLASEVEAGLIRDAGIPGGILTGSPDTCPSVRKLRKFSQHLLLEKPHEVLDQKSA